MATKIIKAWINGAIQNIEVEDIISPEQEPALEDRLAALESTHVTKTLNSVTLLADKWDGDVSPYSQVVEITGTTEHSKVDLQPNLEQLAIFYEKDLAFVTENDDGVITVFCIGQKPTNDYTIQITVTEVHLDE